MVYLKTALRLFFKICNWTVCTLTMVGAVLVFSRKLPNQWRTRPCSTVAILGNGPSLKIDLERLERFLPSKSIELWAVNNFCFSEEFSRFQPAVYVLADPNYWEANVNSEVELARTKFIAELNEKLTWHMILLLPVTARGSDFLGCLKNPLLNIQFYNSTPISGSRALSFWFMRRQLAMPAALNVLISAISLAACSSFQKIYIFGADHSWHECVTVTNAGEALVEQHHFYKERVEPRPIFRPAQPNFTIGDMFLRWGAVFKSYELIRSFVECEGIAVINASSKSYIDAFDRKIVSSSL